MVTRRDFLSAIGHAAPAAWLGGGGGGARLREITDELARFTGTPEEIAQYVATGECDDKAGAYAIQGRAARFIIELRGSYSGVMGLPLYETSQLLEKLRERRNPY